MTTRREASKGIMASDVEADIMTVRIGRLESLGAIPPREVCMITNLIELYDSMIPQLCG